MTPQEILAEFEDDLRRQNAPAAGATGSSSFSLSSPFQLPGGFTIPPNMLPPNLQIPGAAAPGGRVRVDANGNVIR